MDNITWINLKKIIQKIKHGTIKVKIENGQPVFLPPQTMLRQKKDGVTEHKSIDEGIDLTKEAK